MTRLRSGCPRAVRGFVAPEFSGRSIFRCPTVNFPLHLPITGLRRPG